MKTMQELAAVKAAKLNDADKDREALITALLDDGWKELDDNPSKKYTIFEYNSSILDYAVAIERDSPNPAVLLLSDNRQLKSFRLCPSLYTTLVETVAKNEQL